MNKPCIDRDGKKHAHREEWDQGKCEHCRCDNGDSDCTSPRCLDLPLGKQCTLQPGTEHDCCPYFDCEEGTLILYFFLPFDTFSLKRCDEKTFQIIWKTS